MAHAVTRSLALLTIVAACGQPQRADAQSHPFEVIFENDFLHSGPPGLGFSDQEYSHGLIFASERNSAPLWGRAFPNLSVCSAQLSSNARCLQTRVEGGQKIFTPEITEVNPSPVERPYAGWLFGAVTGRVVTQRTSRSLRAEVGITGPLSMAAQLQKAVHTLTGFPQPLGWDYQLRTEPGVLIEYEERHLRERRSDSGMRVADVALSTAAAVGNVRTGVRGGITARAGYRLPHPWDRKVEQPPFAAFGIASVERNWTAHDLFLDGNTFVDGPRVERIPFTGSFTVGVGLQYHHYRLTTAVVFQDPLYVSQPKAHRYNALTLTINP